MDLSRGICVFSVFLKEIGKWALMESVEDEFYLAVGNLNAEWCLGDGGRIPFFGGAGNTHSIPLYPGKPSI